MSKVILLKRLFDVFAASLLLILLMPIMIVVALLIRLNMGSPVFFSQERIGYRGQAFWMRKFRTMGKQTDESGGLLPDEQRITRLGRFLRSTSIDELPELFHVVKGEMSLVGPRPLLPRYLPFYTDTEQRRHMMRPGITGLAQVHGRNFLSWDERLQFDVQYVDEWTFWLDIVILIRTVFQVIRRRGVADVPSNVMKDLDEVRLGR